MKKILLGCVVLLIVLTTKSFAQNYNTEEIINLSYADRHSHVKEVAAILFESEIEKELTENLYKGFLKSEIPEKFVEPFYEFTKNNKNLGLEILGIAKHESNWKWFVGKRNANGSIDLGPLMLNSYNIENETFMNSFAFNCKEYEDDIDIYFMCICINYYKDLRKSFGAFNALQVYNGGWRTVNKNCPKNLKNTVIIYANTVYKYINAYAEKYEEFKTENRTNEIEPIIERFAYRVPFYQMFDSMYSSNIFSSLNSKYSSSSLYSDYKCTLTEELIFINDDEFFEFFVLGGWRNKHILIEKVYEFGDDEEIFLEFLC